MLRLGNTVNHASFVFDNKKQDVLKYKDTDMSVYRAIVEANKEHGDETALIFMDCRISYKQLIAQADQVSDIMTSLNIRKGDMILLGSNSPQAVSILLACSKIGVGAMILTERTTPELFAQTVSAIDIPLMFCTNDIYVYFSGNSVVDELAHIVIMPYDTPIGKDTSDKEFNDKISNICTWDEFLNYKIIEYSEEVYGGYFPLTISASTGSTGNPKGIVLENQSYIALFKMVKCANFNWKRGDILAATLSIGVVSGTSLLLLIPLMMGVSVLQHPRYPGINPFSSFLKNVALYKANILFSPPSLWIAMIEANTDDVDLSNVKCVYTIGETISVIEYNVINCFLKENHATDKLRNMYGMSEVNSMATYFTDMVRDNISVGVAAPYNIISIFDPDTLCEKNFGEIGEVFIYTPTAMREYIYNPIETKKFFIRDNRGRKWVRTGDLGVLNNSGELRTLGRISQRFVVSEGEYIYPYMLENLLLNLPEVSRFKMVNTVYNGKNTYALHVIPNDLTVDKKRLVQKISDILAQSNDVSVLPGLIKIRENFPKNPGGKIDMTKLAQEKEGFILLK